MFTSPNRCLIGRIDPFGLAVNGNRELRSWHQRGKYRIRVYWAVAWSRTPSHAAAAADCCKPVVPLQEQRARVIDHIRSQGYFVVDSEPSHNVLIAHPRVAMIRGDDISYDAVRTPMDLPIAKEVIAAGERARGKVVKWPTMGGSVPLVAMERAANTHTITVPM